MVEKKKLKNGVRPIGRRRQVEPVPFREMLPLSLKNQVSGRSAQRATAICVHEMSIMFSCLKTNDFNEGKCTAAIEGFQQCVNSFKANYYKTLNDEKKAGIGSTAGNSLLNARQLNIFLKKFPHPR